MERTWVQTPRFSPKSIWRFLNKSLNICYRAIITQNNTDSYWFYTINKLCGLQYYDYLVEFSLLSYVYIYIFLLWEYFPWYSNLPDILHVATKVCMILGRDVGAWYREMWHCGISQSQHCNNDNNDKDDNVMRAMVWLEFFDGILQCHNPWYMGKQCDNKEWFLSKAHPFSNVLVYKRGNHIMEGNITEVTVVPWAAIWFDT